MAASSILAGNTKVSRDMVYDLQYVDDTAIPSHSATGLQLRLSILVDTYKHAGLAVSTKEIEILIQPANS